MSINHAAPKLERCSRYRRNTMQAYPRTCEVCGLGPCKFPIATTHLEPPVVVPPGVEIHAYGKTDFVDMAHLLATADQIAAEHRRGTLETLRAFYRAGIRVVADHRLQDGSFSILVSPGDFKAMKDEK